MYAEASRRGGIQSWHKTFAIRQAGSREKLNGEYTGETGPAYRTCEALRSVVAVLGHQGLAAQAVPPADASWLIEVPWDGTVALTTIRF